MNKWLQRWQGMAPREQWLTYGVGLALLGMLYLLLAGDPLSAAVARTESSIRLAEGRSAEATVGLEELKARLAATVTEVTVVVSSAGKSATRTIPVSR